MQGFKLDNNGDIAIENGEIAFVSDNELTAQTLQTVLGTNKGEWFMNENEGVDFGFLLGKGITDDMRLGQVTDAAYQVDERLQVVGFSCEEESSTRKSTIHFSVKDDEENIIIGGSNG